MSFQKTKSKPKLIFVSVSGDFSALFFMSEAMAGDWSQITLFVFELLNKINDLSIKKEKKINVVSGPLSLLEPEKKWRTREERLRPAQKKIQMIRISVTFLSGFAG